ncbi:MAG: YfiR family protein, partial [Candidatus Solibacter usitatus]|nr:YfiR family protein [Candidatus Solibacter usitatus]
MAFLIRPALCHCLAWAALSGSVHAQAHTAGQLEYEVKAAFLYNFAKFAEWPGEKAGDAFIVGTLGQ